ncbi:MAG: SpoIIE family protein phosphatase [Acidobacteriota bacterium]|jgi:sigma-B regulation protein RsbU (phosphoserine phosphatase)|nr:SpoIIE family protein phosphatase [Acidobacteriota bacterium]
MKTGGSQIISQIRKLLPRSKAHLGIYALFMLAIWVLGVFLMPAQFFPANPVAGILIVLLSLLLLGPAIYCLWRIYRRVKTGFLWKIRRRLILVYVFVGAIPLVIIAGIFYISAVFVYYQFSYFLVFKQIGIHSSQIHAFTLSLREGLHQMALENPGVSPERLRKAVDEESKYILSAYPFASIILNCENPETGESVAYVSRQYISTPLEGYKVPEWLDGEFNSLVLEEGYGEDAAASRLFLRSFAPSFYHSNVPFSLEVTVPFDRYLMERLKAAFGQNVLLARYTENTGLNGTDSILESTFDTENTVAAMKWMLPIPLFPISWDSGEELEPFRTNTLMVEISFQKLLSSLRHSDSVFGQWIYNALIIITIVFILAEAASITLGILLTRSITQAIHNLDQGTQYVKRGDFSHSIVVRSRDQLGALAASFNQMTEYVRQLIKERVEKERLEREIEIAREVQERLFPNGAPRMKHLEIVGACLPARVVSGDYYDFIPFGEDSVGLVVGDISGKGISAALLMASLQAALHSNVMYLNDAADESGGRNVAEIVERLNRQIYNYTGTNRFASFFCAHYDGSEQTIIYCNAGHNPPLHFHGGECRRLDVGGTVVGIFPESTYEQETLRLAEGDMIVAYTDGLTECTDINGEEFGEERLIELIQDNREMPLEDLSEKVLESVLAWSSTEEQADDITLIIARQAPMLLN